MSRTHDALVALDAAALAARVDAAAAQALAAFPAARWSALPPVIAAAERVRLPIIATDWIETIELPRAGFVVERIEAKATVELADLTFRLTLDRVDSLAGGGHAIVDYKTGQVDSTKAWFWQRPAGAAARRLFPRIAGGDAAAWSCGPWPMAG